MFLGVLLTSEAGHLSVVGHLYGERKDMGIILRFIKSRVNQF